jgi:hypothetical protein
MVTPYISEKKDMQVTAKTLENSLVTSILQHVLPDYEDLFINEMAKSCRFSNMRGQESHHHFYTGG